MTNLEYFIFAFVSLYVLIEPVSLVPIFLGLTPAQTAKQRVRIIWLACGLSTVLLLFFALTGLLLFEWMGVTLPAFQIAGGVLLFLLALQMLHAGTHEPRLTEEENTTAARSDDIAITPLAMPLLAGPGAISSVILLKSRAENMAQHALLYASIVLIMLVTLVLLWFSAAGSRLVSPLVMKLIHRLSGFVLATLAVQFIVNGLGELPFLLPSGD